MRVRRASFKVRRRWHLVRQLVRFFESRPSSFWVRLVGPLLMGVAFNKALYIVTPPDVSAYYLAHIPAWVKLTDMLVCIVSAYVVSECAVALTRYLDRFQPWEEKPVIRLLSQAALTELVALVAVAIVGQGYDWLMLQFGIDPHIPNRDEWLELQQYALLGSWLMLMLMATYIGSLFFQRWKASLTEAAELRQVAAQAQLDALKAQIDPHFLFNNFSTLTALIEEDSKLAVEYLSRLSQVYRYVLLHRDRDRTTLGQELDFIRAFLFLSQVRFGDDALRVEISLPEASRAAAIAPLTLQLLVENALKHNVISRSTPLHVRISLAPEGWLEVRNLRQPLVRPEASSGMGLKNITARYALLGAPKPEVVVTDTEFVVRIPLLAEPAMVSSGDVK